MLLYVECEFPTKSTDYPTCFTDTKKSSVSDGVYLFSQMESVYWIARRYEIPFLMVVLNNGGWNAPKVSALLVHKDGLSSKSNRRGESNGS